jgi:aspartyl-tRNA(Asn)/glutamyl-tRNA(Gln) amidotransferase subunit A
MPNEFSFMTAIETLDLMRTKQVSPVEIVDSALRRAEASQSTLNAFVTLTSDLAMEAARKAEKAILAGEDQGLLTGLPLSIKDLTAVKGVRFTSGSRTLANFVAPVDSPASERVKAHGAAIIGKTTTTEFGCKGSSNSPLSGDTRNPWDLGRTTGGSSAGAGASVAAGLTPFALGTDGGGSIRIPSSFCGLFGIKAHFGRVPVFPAAATPTLAHVGPMGRTVRCRLGKRNNSRDGVRHRSVLCGLRASAVAPCPLPTHPRRSERDRGAILRASARRRRQRKDDRSV